ncbi:MAG TPA: hypothetical protein VK927_11965 [Adhaeribacter sp.]|nr:hypothetical protein [Adhaeribacter sp.]
MVILIWCCLSFRAAFAQQVTYKGDQILVNKQPYALLKKSGNALIRDFSLQNLQGQELAMVKATIIDLPNNENYIYYTATFFPEGQQAELENAIGFGKKLAGLVVHYDLVKNNALNPEGLTKFLQVYNQKPSERFKNVSPVAAHPSASSANADLQYQTVARNRQADISVMGKNLQQDFRTIGTFAQTDQATRGIIVRTLRFSLPDGTPVAEATFEGLDAENCTLVTLRDNKMHRISATPLDIETPEILAKFLADRHYL